MNGLAPDPEHLDRPAIVDPSGAVVTHGALLSAIDRLASEIGTGQKVVAFCMCGADLPSIVAYRAAVAADMAVVLLDSSLDDARLADLVTRYRPEVLLGVDRGRLAAAGIDDEYDAASLALALDVPTRLAIGIRRNVSEPSPHPDLAVLLSTSGSTGSPKLVRLTLENVVANARSIVASLGIDSGERAIVSMPFAYSYGLSVLNTHLTAGASLVLAGATSLERSFWETVRRERCTSFAGVPYAYHLLERIGFARFDLPALKTLTQAGGKLDDERVAAFHELMTARGGRFFVMYGQTEATARMACLPSEWLPAKLGSAGRAIPGGSFAIEIDGLMVTEPGVDGEIVYRGPNVMLGYALDRGDLARGDELAGRLCTGDLGHVDGDGCLYVTGRSKRIAKLFGFRVNLDEVEAIVAPWGPAAVVTRNDRLYVFLEECADTIRKSRGGDAGVAEPGSNGDRERRLGLARRLKVHHSAIEIRPVPQLPRGTNGKVDYGELNRWA